MSSVETLLILRNVLPRQLKLQIRISILKLQLSKNLTNLDPLKLTCICVNIIMLKSILVYSWPVLGIVLRYKILQESAILGQDKGTAYCGWPSYHYIQVITIYGSSFFRCTRCLSRVSAWVSWSAQMFVMTADVSGALLVVVLFLSSLTCDDTGACLRCVMLFSSRLARREKH